VKPVYIDTIGLVAPGLPSWQEGSKVLTGETSFLPEPLERYKPQLLPPNERRRATNLIRLAFQAGEDAIAEKDLALNTLATVFASSGGDYEIIDKICRALTSQERAVSPTQFHNSVHNSAAGYWSIGTGSQAPSISLSGFDFSFATGLLEAVMLATVEELPTLLVVYDIRPPSPLYEKRPIAASFAMAMLLSPQKTGLSSAQLNLRLDSATEPESHAYSNELESVRIANPAARAIPLLELLAQQQNGSLRFSLPGSQSLIVGVQCD
jgi:hypothetical protein